MHSKLKFLQPMLNIKEKKKLFLVKSITWIEWKKRKWKTQLKPTSFLQIPTLFSATKQKKKLKHLLCQTQDHSLVHKKWRTSKPNPA